MPPEEIPNQPPQESQPIILKTDAPNLVSILAYLGILIIIPVLVAKDDPFVKFHIKQGIGLIILWLIFWVLSFVLGIFLAVTRLPFLTLIFPVLWLLSVILMIIGITNAATGKTKELPIIGSWGNKFNF